MSKPTKLASMETTTPLPFTDFPDDVQLCVLSFLDPSDLSSLSLTCKRFLALFHDPRLWLSMCLRRWGHKTLIHNWGGAHNQNNSIPYDRLYRILHHHDPLIGFWRSCGTTTTTADSSNTSLVLFEWGPFYITGSRISPSKNGGYGVVKKPFLWITVGPNGDAVNYLDPDGKICSAEVDLIENLDGCDLIRVNVSFIGECHVVVEEESFSSGLSSSSRASTSSGNLSVMGIEEFESAVLCGSPPDKLVTEIYQYLANRTSPGASRRQRRREREKYGRGKRWESEHFVKIVNCSPVPGRPLQGLWKGICDDMSLDFYLVSYDDVGGIACRKVGDSNKPLSHHAPIFWTSSSTLIESPFSPEEDHIYNCRLHLRPPLDQIHDHLPTSDDEAVSRMLYINSSYDLVIPDLAAATVNPRRVEGRIWQYGNGTFGFGFLMDNYIVDLKHIAINGQLLDILDPNND